MDVEEILEFADHLVFAMTGKHLDSLQKAILRGAWDNQKYREIAESHHRSEKYVKEVGFKLWRLLSNILGEELSKTNFRAALERRWRFSQLLPFWKAFVANDNLNSNNCNFAKLKNIYELDEDISEVGEGKISLFSSHRDLNDAPDVFSFWGRTEELSKLEKWIVQERCRLVAILGMSGIGKTALAVKLVEGIQDKFEFVIWRSLCCKPSLEVIQKNLIQILSNQEESEVPENADARLSQLIEYLRKYRCLVILDDVHLLFSSGQLAGCYEAGYEDYSLLFRRLGELNHDSCFLLTSWEKPREIATLEGENQPVRSLQLHGLDLAYSAEILREKTLAKEEKWQDLINHYGGNPLWLKIVAAMVYDLFDGDVCEFLKYDTLLLSEDLKYILTQQFKRLSELEKNVISRLASENEPVYISNLLEYIQLQPSDLFNAIQSLRRRSFIEKEEGGGMVFTLQPVLRQYVKNQYYCPCK
ncbi:NB-ARC domain-containing protein [Aerosakkonema funiforme]|uniref:NB-ARC domain-containing protein n=1 Tax=Aerosakkonema funiforme TaxID=1246630 RepID=UPI0035BAE9ED